MTTTPIQPTADKAANAPPEPVSGTRLDSLTGLRALAAFGVFLAHLNVFLPIPHTNGLFSLGGAGVPYFFILSGFVLAWTFTSKDTARAFYGRRFARIWPLALLSAVVSVLIALDLSQGTDVSKTLWLGAASALLIHAWFQTGILSSPNPVSWPVSVEVFYYALFPLLIRPILRRTLKQLAVIFVGLVAVSWAIRVTLWIMYPPSLTAPMTPHGITAQVFGTMSPPARLNEFLIGIVVAAAIRKGWRCRVPVSVAVGLLVASLGVLLAYQGAAFRAATITDALDQVSAPLFALLIASVASRELSGHRDWLSSRVMVAFGMWSYAFFLFHYLVLYLVASAVFHKHSMTAFFYSTTKPSYADAGWAALAFVIALALAGTLHHFFEHPIEQRLRKLFRGRQVKHEPEQGASA